MPTDQSTETAAATYDDPDHWYPVITDRRGYVEPDPDTIVDNADPESSDQFPDDFEISVVRNSARPNLLHGEYRAPGTFQRRDCVMIAPGVMHNLDSAGFREAWLDAEAIADRRNTAGA